MSREEFEAWYGKGTESTHRSDAWTTWQVAYAAGLERAAQECERYEGASMLIHAAAIRSLKTQEPTHG